ncbi:MAG: GntR family transcriptional regulator [Woeseiaceae bacterium]|nr:GntR family transcriptional regulator [Woeseiaceae bacterium]
METNRSIASIPDFQPLYKQVYAMLVRRIADGDWRPGETMPSEQALAVELGVSQGTVRKAMDALASQNLIVRRQGKGSFVAEHTQEHALYRFFRLARPAPSRERVTPQLGAASIKRRAANRAEQSTLQLSEKAEIVEIRRTRLVDQVPSIVEKIVLPLALFPDIESYNSLPNTLYSLYQGAYGLSVAFVKEALRAVIANKRDAKALQIEVGTPLLQIDRVAFGLDGQQIEWRVSRCDTSNIVYAVDVT